MTNDLEEIKRRMVSAQQIVDRMNYDMAVRGQHPNTSSELKAWKRVLEGLRLEYEAARILSQLENSK